ncbi:type IV pilus modification PilV family protein [Brevundimonas variabilis]|uniref:Prepilin-type N-terminal cleavage/methylation domain-containing protein n=1 Tax=Brevundimonas variabilis TaxID=74312 RepID=A0A7W9CGP4_9CAUL|nr:type II secretion system protein [Brevundimonas variabilis]MBB5745327.1 prepilin-type N-terminal cleavage/methylation domain-containing protein [Brevundimonas variabilis]
MKRRRSGFSLIEALVALTIAAVTLAAIFELQVQMVRGQQRAVEAMEQVAAQENALALTRDINPMVSPQGEIRLPEGDTISWVSEPLGLPRQNAGFPAENGIYQVQLFRLTVRIERARGRSPGPLVFNRMGWANAVQSEGR